MGQPHFNGAADETLVLLSPGQSRLEMIYARNIDFSINYIQFFDAASEGAVTLGSTTPKLSIGTHGNNVIQLSKFKAMFVNGIVYAATSTPTGSGGPTNGLILNIVYS
jgi:hypothetical protein